MKYHYSIEFFWALLKNEGRDYRINKYLAAAAQNDILILITHVNGGSNFEIKEVEGEKIIQIGLTAIKGVGKKTAEKIVEYGPYKSKEDFKEKCPKRYANSRVVEKLEEEGALLFNNKTYWRRTIKYNTYLNNANTSIY